MELVKAWSVEGNQEASWQPGSPELVLHTAGKGTESCSSGRSGSILIWNMRKHVLNVLRACLTGWLYLLLATTLWWKGGLSSPISNRTWKLTLWVFGNPILPLTYTGVPRTTLTYRQFFFGMLNIWCKGSLLLLLSNYVSERDLETPLSPSRPKWCPYLPWNSLSQKIKEYKLICTQSDYKIAQSFKF